VLERDGRELVRSRQRNGHKPVAIDPGRAARAREPASLLLLAAPSALRVLMTAQRHALPLLEGLLRLPGMK
jgi:hypothetical protein